MPKLVERDITSRLASLKGWSRRENEIQKLYTHKNFKEAMGFVNRVAQLAEKANHHPDILIKWNKVTLTLSTHSEGGLTDKDFNLAAQIDAT